MEAPCMAVLTTPAWGRSTSTPVVARATAPTRASVATRSTTAPATSDTWRFVSCLFVGKGGEFAPRFGQGSRAQLIVIEVEMFIRPLQDFRCDLLHEQGRDGAYQKSRSSMTNYETDALSNPHLWHPRDGLSKISTSTLHQSLPKASAVTTTISCRTIHARTSALHTRTAPRLARQLVAA